MCKLSILGRIHGNIAEHVDVIAKVTYWMHLNKVEIRFGMYQFNTLVVLFFTIVVTDPAPLGWGHSLPHLGSLTMQLLAQLISLLLRPFEYAKLQEDVLRPVVLRRIFFHIRYSLGCVTSVLSHHGEVKSDLTQVSARLKGCTCVLSGCLNATARTPNKQRPRFLISFPCHCVTSL